jgi:hypothetical protein
MHLAAPVVITRGVSVAVPRAAVRALVARRVTAAPPRVETVLAMVLLARVSDGSSGGRGAAVA